LAHADGDQRAGDVVGFSNPPGDPNGEFIVHAFLWTRRGGIKDLGTLPGDSTSQALGVNARGQVVGLSTSTAGTNRAFIWQDDVMTDLQKLMLPGFADSLISAQDINDHGRITGRLFDRASGQLVTYVATPIPR
jgi:probable HAF family extracellular repeat protein